MVVLLVCFVLTIVIFTAFIGFVVFFCIYEDILKICFNMFGNISQKCEHFSYEIFFVIIYGFWES